MKKYVFTLAAIAALAVSGPALAQNVDADSTKELWCGTALSIYYGIRPADASADDIAKAQQYADAADGMVSEATQKYLNGGYTEEQMTKLKDQLKSDITKIVTGKDEAGNAVTEAANPPPYTFNDCLLMLQPRVPPDVSSSSKAP
jgi:hypothetical protein